MKVTSKGIVNGVIEDKYGKHGTQFKSSFYGGMAPPDAPHIYEIHVYALETELELENGFMYNELYRKMDGHVLEQVTIKGSYRN